MATSEAINQAIANAQLSVLQKIVERMEGLGGVSSGSPTGAEIRYLAEAFAWLVGQNQAHGGGSEVRVSP